MNAVEKKVAAMRKAGKLEGLDDRKARALAKAHVHGDAERELPMRFTHEGIHITVHRVSVFEGALRVDLTASVRVRGPFLFLNPPTQVEEGKDDADAALREMVGRAVAYAARTQR
jgi:hypothetical protein